MLESVLAEERPAELLKVVLKTTLRRVRDLEHQQWRPLDWSQTWLRAGRMKTETEGVVGSPLVACSVERDWDTAS